MSDFDLARSDITTGLISVIIMHDVFDLFFDGWGFREKLHQRVDKIIKARKEKLKPAG